MSEDWKVGDHAVCVEDCTFRSPKCYVTADIPDIYFQLGPRKGQRFVVTAVEIHRLPEDYDTQIEVYLRLREMPGDKAYLARQFRKIDPVETEERDGEVVKELNRQPEQVPA